MTATIKIDYLLAIQTVTKENTNSLKDAFKAMIQEQKKPIDFSDFAKPGILSDASSSKKPAQKAINNNNNKKGPSV
jgi:Ca2+-binding EF-hand superfamily protein